MKLYYELTELEEAKALAKDFSKQHKCTVLVEEGLDIDNDEPYYFLTQWPTAKVVSYTKPVTQFYCGNEVK